jgi:hypothetical protein
MNPAPSGAVLNDRACFSGDQKKGAEPALNAGPAPFKPGSHSATPFSKTASANDSRSATCIHPRRPRGWFQTDAAIDLIATRYSQGEAVAAIAAELHVTIATVYRALDIGSVELRPATKLTTEQALQVADRRAAGEGACALGREFGVSHQAIAEACRRAERIRQSQVLQAPPSTEPESREAVLLRTIAHTTRLLDNPALLPGAQDVLRFQQQVAEMELIELRARQQQP